MKSPILGASYKTRSVNACDNRMVNLFPESIDEGGKESAYLMRAPGTRLLQSVGDGPIRGMWAYGGKCYIVSGRKLFSISNSKYPSEAGYSAALEIGTIGGTGMVSMSDNGTQLFIAAGTTSYIYNNSDLTLVQITDPDFNGASKVGYLDEMFVYIEPNSDKLWVTAIGDGTDIRGLDSRNVYGTSDNLVSMIIDHDEVWLFGTNSTGVWYNTASSDFPIAKIQGAFTEVGCIAKDSVAKMDNSIFWLGKDARGYGMVYRSNGYRGVRVSTHAVEWQIQQYSRLEDAVAYTYQQDGHSFYVLNFPAADTTWVYDVATDLWHERAGFDNGVFTRHRGQCQASFDGKVLVGDYQLGNVGVIDLDTYTDYGLPQKWLRSWRALPTGSNTLKRTIHHSLQLDCETGFGETYPVNDDTYIMLRWSDDGGHTWPAYERVASLGKVGKYATRVIWRRLGMTTKLRDRVYEISGTGSTKISIMGAELIASDTNA